VFLCASVSLWPYLDAVSVTPWLRGDTSRPHPDGRLRLSGGCDATVSLRRSVRARLVAHRWRWLRRKRIAKLAQRLRTRVVCGDADVGAGTRSAGRQRHFAIAWVFTVWPVLLLLGCHRSLALRMHDIVAVRSVQRSRRPDLAVRRPRAVGPYRR